MEKVIAQGAEALLIRKNGLLIKKRISKSYRTAQIDATLRKARTRREGRLLEKASRLISVPHVEKIDENKNEIVMEFIPGKVLSASLESFDRKKALEICFEIGKEIAVLHNSDIIHGDLTTSNMIFWKGKVWIIDFGLSFHSARAEDKAVDLHLLRQALESKHFSFWKDYYAAMLAGYKKEGKNSAQILLQLKKVEARGRYKGKNKTKQPMIP
jgi:Kae1-associated kinase Bud32